MKWQKQEAIFGAPPAVGDRVYVDFGDSVGAPPETRDKVTYIGDKGVALEHGDRRYNWFEIAHIQVVAE